MVFFNSRLAVRFGVHGSDHSLDNGTAVLLRFLVSSSYEIIIYGRIRGGVQSLNQQVAVTLSCLFIGPIPELSNQSQNSQIKNNRLQFQNAVAVSLEWPRFQIWSCLQCLFEGNYQSRFFERTDYWWHKLKRSTQKYDSSSLTKKNDYFEEVKNRVPFSSKKQDEPPLRECWPLRGSVGSWCNELDPRWQWLWRRRLMFCPVVSPRFDRIFPSILHGACVRSEVYVVLFYAWEWLVLLH